MLRAVRSSRERASLSRSAAGSWPRRSRAPQGGLEGGPGRFGACTSGQRGTKNAGYYIRDRRRLCRSLRRSPYLARPRRPCAHRLDGSGRIKRGPVEDRNEPAAGWRTARRQPRSAGRVVGERDGRRCRHRYARRSPRPCSGRWPARGGRRPRSAIAGPASRGLRRPAGHGRPRPTPDPIPAACPLSAPSTSSTVRRYRASAASWAAWL